MNAYYSEILFRGLMGNLDIPGVIVADDCNGELINIHPIGTGKSISSVALCSVDIVELVKIAVDQGMFDSNQVQMLNEVLRVED